MPVETTHKTLSAVDFFRAKLSYEVTPWTLSEELPKGQHRVVDVRDAQAYAAEHIPAAVNIPLAELPGRLGELPRDKTIVTYCGSITCSLGPKAALQLAEKDFKVQVLFGGLEAWKKGFDTEGTAAGKAKKPSRRR